MRTFSGLPLPAHRLCTCSTTARRHPAPVRCADEHSAAHKGFYARQKDVVAAPSYGQAFPYSHLSGKFACGVDESPEVISATTKESPCHGCASSFATCWDGTAAAMVTSEYFPTSPCDWAKVVSTVLYPTSVLTCVDSSKIPANRREIYITHATRRSVSFNSEFETGLSFNASSGARSATVDYTASRQHSEPPSEIRFCR